MLIFGQYFFDFFNLQISEGGRIIQIRFVLAAVVIGQYPWKNGVLHQVIVTSSSQGVEGHQILEVCDFASNPSLGYRSLPHKGRKKASTLLYTGRQPLAGNWCLGIIGNARRNGPKAFKSLCKINKMVNELGTIY